MAELGTTQSTFELTHGTLTGFSSTENGAFYVSTTGSPDAAPVAATRLARGIMSSVLIATGATYQISVLLLNSAGAGLSGSTARLRVRRASDNRYYDFATNTFLASGWSAIETTMVEVDAANDPGAYVYSWNTSLISNPVANDTYVWRVEAAGASAPERGEIRVSTVVDRIDTATSTRSTPADVMSAQSAIVASVNTRAAPSDVTAATTTIVAAVNTRSAPSDVTSARDAVIASVESRASPADVADARDAVLAQIATRASAVDLTASTNSILAAVAALPSQGSIAGAVWATVVSGAIDVTTAGGALYALKQLALNRLEEAPGNPGTLRLYADDATTVRLTFTLRDSNGGAIVASVGQPARRSGAA